MSDALSLSCAYILFSLLNTFYVLYLVEAVELNVQLERMRSMFGLSTRMKGEFDERLQSSRESTASHPITLPPSVIEGEPYITWDERCRFALVIFSVVRNPNGSPSSDLRKMVHADSTNSDIVQLADQVPWTFVHEERPNAPATLLENTLRSTHLRAWDFVTGEALASKLPIVFSFADDPRDKRSFMMVSRSAGRLQQFQAPGEGDILGMGANAIVHRVQLAFTQADGGHRDENWTTVNIGLENKSSSSTQSKNTEEREWDSAVKRPFSLGKMLVFLQNSSEAGLAKRLRLANLLNSDRRILYFYGLGIGLSTNACNQNEYKFELMLLSKYDENFASYTMRVFMEEYLTRLSSVADETVRISIERMQSEFSITSVKVFLVSLLNGESC